MVGPANVCGAGERSTYPSIGGQHDGNRVSEPPGRNHLKEAVKPGDRNLELGTEEATDPSCGAHSGSGQCHSRQRVQEGEGFQQLDAGSESVPETDVIMGSLRHRPLCSETQLTVRALLQLQAGPLSLSHGCSGAGLELQQALHVPSVHSLGQSAAEVSCRPGGGSSADSTDVAISSLVSITPPGTDRLPEDNTDTTTSNPRPTGEPSPVRRKTTLSRMESVRNLPSHKGISEEAFELICAGYREVLLHGMEEMEQLEWWKG